ncbi:MAG: hypothetical protein JWP75_1509 [Frondihabitans sp.]|nr:hypothetical protein [Frondihabitans sp.]
MELRAKLQLKPGQAVEAALVPDEILPLLGGIDVTSEPSDDAALLVFVTNREILQTQEARIAASAQSDHLTWVAYPKAGQLGTDLARDSLAAHLRQLGTRPVRQISLDEVWSALRFRPA